MFLDRIKTQEEIQGFLETVFGTKKRISLDEFKRINIEESSEMFLAVMILLQNSLPCTENFHRYQKNFEKYVNTGDDTQETKKVIASPKLISKLSPISNLARNHGVDFNPPSQGNLLRYAVNNKGEKVEEQEEQKAELDEGGVPVNLPQSNKQVKADRKERADQAEAMVKEGTDVVDQTDTIRLPNAVKKEKGMTLSTDPNKPTQQMVMSPTAFLTGGQASPKLSSFCTNDDSKSV